ncbi:50S ribosomal protein L11, partial [archaeon]|nr:50S ribosomal protein L11 [archaeon]
MGNEVVEALVNGGKATAGPPIGPALGPLGVNIGEVISQINSKTKDFVGMSVPVKIIVNTDDKSFKITVGTPPTSQLLIKEAK